MDFVKKNMVRIGFYMESLSHALLIDVLIHKTARSFVPCVVSRLLERHVRYGDDNGWETAIKEVGTTAFAGQRPPRHNTRFQT